MSRPEEEASAPAPVDTDAPASTESMPDQDEPPELHGFTSNHNELRLQP